MITRPTAARGRRGAHQQRSALSCAHRSNAANGMGPRRSCPAGARETPRSAIIATMSRSVRDWRYQRTHRTMIAASKWRPLKTAARLSSLLTRPPIHERSVAHLPDMGQRSHGLQQNRLVHMRQLRHSRLCRRRGNVAARNSGRRVSKAAAMIEPFAQEGGSSDGA
jgi:hypothetical protein